MSEPDELTSSLRARALFAAAMDEDAEIRMGRSGPTKTALQCQIERRGWTVEEYEEQQDARRRGELAGGGEQS